MNHCNKNIARLEETTLAFGLWSLLTAQPKMTTFYYYPLSNRGAQLYYAAPRPPACSRRLSASPVAKGSASTAVPRAATPGQPARP